MRQEWTDVLDRVGRALGTEGLGQMRQGQIIQAKGKGGRKWRGTGAPRGQQTIQQNCTKGTSWSGDMQHFALCIYEPYRAWAGNAGPTLWQGPDEGGWTSL